MTQPLREILDVSNGGEIAVGSHGSLQILTGGSLLVGGLPPLTAIPRQLCTVAHASPIGGGYVTQFVFDDTASTGGLYAWTGTDYTKVGLAAS